MEFNLEVSRFRGRGGKPAWPANPLGVFWPKAPSWYRPPRAGYYGQRGRFLGGFNLGSWIVRLHATWNPR